MIVAYSSDVCAVAKRTGNLASALLWEYFFKNEDGYTVGLSQEEMTNTLGIGRTVYENALKSLIQFGYLKLRDGSKVHYDFIPYPQD